VNVQEPESGACRTFEAKLSEKARHRLLDLDSPAFVRTCYRILLGREPDFHGFEDYLSGLQSGRAKEEVLESFLSGEEFRRNRAGLLQELSAFVETAGTLDLSDREFLDEVARLVAPESTNLRPG
jgi:hypothetical protein